MRLGDNVENLLVTVFEEVDTDSLSPMQLVILSYLCEEKHMMKNNKRISGSRFFKENGNIHNSKLIDVTESMDSISVEESIQEESATTLQSNESPQSLTIYKHERQNNSGIDTLNGEKLSSVRDTISGLESLEEEYLENELKKSDQFQLTENGEYIMGANVKSNREYKAYAIGGFVISVVLSVPFFSLFVLLSLLGTVELIRHIITRQRADEWYNKASYGGLLRGVEIYTILAIVFVVVFVVLVDLFVS